MFFKPNIMFTLNKSLISKYDLFIAIIIEIFTVRKRSLGQGNIFAPVCHSVHRGSTWAGTPHPPEQVHPRGQVHPLPGRYTPSWVGTPPRQVHPCNACWDTVNKRAVRILLECILVDDRSMVFLRESVRFCQISKIRELLFSYFQDFPNFHISLLILS